MYEGHEIEEDLLPHLRSMITLDNYKNPRFEECVAVMAAVKKWPIRSLIIDHQSSISLPKHMVNCEFPNLKTLIFQAIEIVSVEGLCKVDMPALELISLSTPPIN